MIINISDEVIIELSRCYTEELGEIPNKADLEAEIENIIREYIEELGKSIHW